MNCNVARCFILILLLSSCEPEVVITKEYVTNSDWGKSLNNIASCDIQKIVVSDSLTLELVEGTTTLKDLGKFFELDSTFCYTKSFTKRSLVDTLFFNKEDKRVLWKPCNKWEKKDALKKINTLQKGWYRFQSVKKDHFYYLYIDSDGNEYLFERSPGLLSILFNH